MDDGKLNEFLSNLNKKGIPAAQFEKNCHKWISQLLTRIHGKYLDDFRVVQAVKMILDGVIRNNQIQILAPHVLSWMNDILSRVTQASNANTYLSILALFLSYTPGPCKQVRRRMWLNLMTFATSPDATSRSKAATILSCASTKDQFSDLYVELLILLEQISPVLIPPGEEIPSPRSITVLSESLLVWKVSREEPVGSKMEHLTLLSRLDFLSKFIRSHILYRGVANFPVEEFLQVVNSSASLSDAFGPVAEIISVFITHHSAELLQIGSLFSTVLLGLSLHTNSDVREVARELIAAWVDQVGPLSGIHERKQFDQLLDKVIQDLPNSSQTSSLTLIFSLINGMGSYLNAKSLVNVTSVLIKTLTANVGCQQKDTKVMLKILSSIVSIVNSSVPSPAIYASEIATHYIVSQKSAPDVKQEARCLLALTDRLKRPFHSVTLIRPKSAEILDLTSVKKVERETVNPLPQISSNISDYLERIEAKLDRFQQERRPSIVQPIRFAPDRIEEPVQPQRDQDRESGQESDYETDDGFPKKDSSPVSMDSFEPKEESADSGEDSIPGEDIYKPGPSKIRKIEEPEPFEEREMEEERGSDALRNIMANFVDEPAERKMN